MSEEKKEPQSSGLGIDGAYREAEFSRLESEAMGGPSGPSQQMGPEQPSTAEIIQPILEMSFAVLAPNWRVSSPECGELSKAYGALADKYFPDGLGNYGVEVTALMVTAAVVMPRLRVPRKVEPERTPVKDEDGNQDIDHEQQ